MGWFFGGRGISEDIARMLPVKTRRIVGIILLSVGFILCMPFVLVLMNVLDDSDASVLIWLILLITGIISMVNSMHFFRKFENICFRWSAPCNGNFRHSRIIKYWSVNIQR